MQTPTHIPDETARQTALNPHQSFIVQAPAGSGKTELLTQRFLVLLAHVKQAPEEILAITFTRKAANEMRSRIMKALNTPTPNDTIQKILARNEKEHWQLFENSHRLRIQTIDSLCASIVKQMPILARMGSSPSIIDDADFLYRQAAQNLLLSLNDEPRWGKSLQTLLLHLDNNFTNIDNLFIEMLKRRDQWMTTLGLATNTQQLRTLLENALENVTCDTLKKLQALTPATLIQELLEVARFAANNLLNAQTTSPITVCHDLEKLPGETLNDKTRWQGVATLLLTKTFSWRKKLTVTEGFPAPSTCKDAAQKSLYANMKDRASSLLTQCESLENFRESLQTILTLPCEKYSQTQWTALTCLLELLPVLVAELHVCFQQHGYVDHTEIAQAAGHALGDPDNPTDLALAFDYRIQHILIDEFQDTSLNQFRLIQQLTAGWQVDDGRTLFLVGDPMQSIYRFRKADVGLFLRVREEGLNELKLTSLRLMTNFRSEPGIVEWINSTFKTAFPMEDNPEQGAISYFSASAFKPMTQSVCVTLHPYIDESPTTEANAIASCIQKTLATDPHAKIAVLVRSKSHLLHVIPALKAASIPYRAIEIDTLTTRPVILDLTALTRALLHLGDRIAWLALLRAPWCGLTLKDLHVITHHAPGKTVWENIVSLPPHALSEEAQQRIDHVIPILSKSLKNRYRLPLHLWIEETWLALQGHTCLTQSHALSDAHTFFELLMKCDPHSFALTELNESLQKLFASPSSEEGIAVELMTIHKSKGLEFDTVILPGLGRALAKDDPQLLLWMERTRSLEKSDLLLAPIKATDEDRDATYDYIYHEESRKNKFETTRLFYVAATRAKKNLHLFGYYNSETQKPASGSLLSHVWEAIGETFMASPHLTPHVEDIQNKELSLRRLPSSFFPKEHSLSAQEIASSNPRPIQTSPLHRIAGIVVHRLLHRLSLDGMAQWDKNKILAQAPLIKTMLLQQGAHPASLTSQIHRVQHALITLLNDEKGRWILSPHKEAHSEYPLTGILDNKPVSVIIDRTFIDETGTRWIIDYKTSDTDSDIENFLDKEQATYQSQMKQYATLFSLMETRPIRCGLYFPLLAAWRSYEE